MSPNLARPKHLSQLFALTLGIWVGGFPLLALADVTFNPPPGRGMPGRREGAGTRDACLKRDPKDPAHVQRSLWALVPDSNLSLTVSDYPTFFWYIPPSNARAIEFSLYDESDQELYHSTFQITGEGGVMSIGLPANSGLPPLQVNKIYRWKFALICDAHDTASNKRLHGWIQRVALDAKLKATLEKATPRQYPELYAQAGIWQDALTTLFELRRTRPRDKALLTDWVKLLQSATLEAIAQEPLVQCCQANQQPHTPPVINHSQIPHPSFQAWLSALNTADNLETRKAFYSPF